jgi:hypothetical protein
MTPRAHSLARRPKYRCELKHALCSLAGDELHDHDCHSRDVRRTPVTLVNHAPSAHTRRFAIAALVTRSVPMASPAPRAVAVRSPTPHRPRAYPARLARSRRLGCARPARLARSASAARAAAAQLMAQCPTPCRPCASLARLVRNRRAGCARPARPARLASKARAVAAPRTRRRWTGPPDASAKQVFTTVATEWCSAPIKAKLPNAG